MFAATVLTLFPAMFPGPLGQSLAGEALAKGLWSLEARDIREHGIGRHRAVDDTPAGGGPGMGRLSLVPSPVVTLRATARLRMANGQYSDFRRTVSAVVKFLGPEWNPPFHVLRWYDNAATVQ